MEGLLRFEKGLRDFYFSISSAPQIINGRPLRTANSLSILPFVRSFVSCPTPHVNTIRNVKLFKVIRYSYAFSLQNKLSAEDCSFDSDLKKNGNV